jgi:hypothetical protein
MALFSVDEDLNIRAVDGGNPDELVSRLAAQVLAAIAAGEAQIVDFNMAGAGSGPKWQAWFVSAASGATPSPIPTNQATFVAAVAGNAAEALFYLTQRLTALAPLSVYKVEVAGAGDGPTFMAVALARREIG